MTASRLRYFRLLSVGAGTAVGIVILAVVLWMRARSPIYLQEPGHELTGHKYIYDRELGWRNIPNWQATTFGHSIRINSKGLRDREYAYEKAPGTRRILVLGDSYAWGYGVANDEIFTEVLETRLAHHQPAHEVLNAGVSGWGTDQQYLYLIREGREYSPDVVLLAFCLVNDLHNNVSSQQYELHKPVFLNTNLEVANVPVPKPGQRAELIKSTADEVELAVAIIDKISQACETDGADLVVMKFGRFLIDAADFLAIDREFTRRLSSRTKFHFLDLDAEFEARGIGRSQLINGNHDGHWNAYGHRQVAIIVQQYLEKIGLVGETPTAPRVDSNQNASRMRRDSEQNNVLWWWDDVPPEIRQVSLDTGNETNILPTDYVGPKACSECHPQNHERWSQHSHRWMNAPANDATVVGDFSGESKIDYFGGQATFHREDDQHIMQLARGNLKRSYRITQTLGSRFFQYYVGHQIEGPEPRSHEIYHSQHVLPFGYWIDYQQWVPVVHIAGAREGEPSVPDKRRRDPFANPNVVDYAQHCSTCHTTPSGGDWLIRRMAYGFPPSPRGLSFHLASYFSAVYPQWLGPDTDPRQLTDHQIRDLEHRVVTKEAPVWGLTTGITCEGCHNGGRVHAQNSDLIMPRFFPVSPHLFIEGHDVDETLGRTAANKNWTCARCHAGKRFEFAGGMATWNSVEYSDALKGACYRPVNGKSHLTCVHCHDPHTTIGRSWDLTPVQDDAKCLQCHEHLRSAPERVAHTHHPMNTTGNRCMNCHMPRLNEGLQDMVRTHMIVSPTNKRMIEANQPNACNMCHVDQSIDWTLQYLDQWYGKTYSEEALVSNYDEKYRNGPAAMGWLHSWQGSTQMVAVDSLARAKAKWALPELVKMLDNKYLLNRQFTRIGLERMLGIQLADFGYQFYMFKKERRDALKQIWRALIKDGSDFPADEDEPDSTEHQIRHLRQVILDKPDYAEAHNNLGVLLIQSKGNHDEAIGYFRRAIALKPDLGEAHYNLGKSLRRTGNLEETIIHFRLAVRFVSDNARPHLRLAQALYDVGRIDEAMAAYEAGLQLDPDSLVMLTDLAWIHATSAEDRVRDGPKAIKLAEHAAGLTQNRDPQVLDILAAAYAATGQFEPATQTAQAAFKLATAGGDEQLAKRIGQRLARYERGEPYLDSTSAKRK